MVKGLSAGDKVAAAGGFLIDAETRLNPAAASTYFGAGGGPQSGDGSQPTWHVEHARAGRPDARPKPRSTGGRPPCRRKTSKNIEQLPEADRQLALAQGICPVTGAALGSMGVPVKITLRGQPVFLCCQGCVGKAKQTRRNAEESRGRDESNASRRNEHIEQ